MASEIVCFKLAHTKRASQLVFCLDSDSACAGQRIYFYGFVCHFTDHGQERCLQ